MFWWGTIIRGFIFFCLTSVKLNFFPTKWKIMIKKFFSNFLIFFFQKIQFSFVFTGVNYWVFRVTSVFLDDDTWSFFLSVRHITLKFCTKFLKSHNLLYFVTGRNDKTQKNVFWSDKENILKGDILVLEGFGAFFFTENLVNRAHIWPNYM